MTYVITTEAEIQQKSGANVNIAYDTTAMENAELRGLGQIQLLTRYMWADNIPTNADIKSILSDYLSSFVAIEAITYDMSNYSSRSEAESMITVLRDGMLRNLSLLRDKKQQLLIQDNAT